MDFFDQVTDITRSKTDAGRRQITLNTDAFAALARLHERAELSGTVEPEHYVFSRVRERPHRPDAAAENMADSVAFTRERGGPSVRKTGCQSRAVIRPRHQARKGCLAAGRSTLCRLEVLRYALTGHHGTGRGWCAGFRDPGNR